MSDKKIWTIYVEPKYKKGKKRTFIIEEYKSITKLTIKLNKLTILVGENASGKSNILTYMTYNSNNTFDLNDSIKKMGKKFYNHAAGAAIDGYKSGYDEIYVKIFGFKNIYIRLNEEKKIFSYQAGSYKTKDLPIEKTLGIGGFLEEGETDYKKTIQFFTESFPHALKNIKQKGINSFDDLIPFRVISLDVANMQKMDVENNISTHLMNLLTIGYNLEEKQNDIYEVLSFLPEIKTNINKVIYEDIGLKKLDEQTNKDKEISVYLTLKTETNKSGIIQANGFQILVRDEAENKVFPPNMKSSGVNNIITIIIVVEFLKYLIEKYPEKNFNKLNYLITIDEPELYLHPKIQRNLINYIYKVSKNIDEIHFLLATHSPYIVHPNVIESTYLLEYEVNKGTVANKLIDIVEKNEDKYSILSPIEDALGLTFNEFLHPVIFVEGEEELDLFRNISKIYRHTSSIHSLNGKNKFSPIAILMKRFKKVNDKSFVFLDADFSFKDDFKSVEDGTKVLESLSKHIFFIGKEIYDYETYKTLKTKDECLEDFIIQNILDDKEYILLQDIVIEVWDKYFELPIDLTKKIKNFLQISSKIRGILNTNKKNGTSFINDKILKDDKFIDKHTKDIYHYVEVEIKEKIKNHLLNNEDAYEKFEKEIIKIITK